MKKKKKKFAANRADYNKQEANANNLKTNPKLDTEERDDDDNSANADVEKVDLDDDNSADAEKVDLDADDSVDADTEKVDLDDDNAADADADAEKVDLDADDSADADTEKVDLDDDDSADADTEKVESDDDDSADADTEKVESDDDDSADADTEKVDLDDDNSDDADTEKVDLDDDNSADVDAEKVDLDDDNSADADTEKVDLDDDNSADADTEKVESDDDSSADADAEKVDLDDDNSADADAEKVELDDDNAAVANVEKVEPILDDSPKSEAKIPIEEMIDANRADCNGCEACVNICPKKAITMTRDAEGFAYPQVNHELCIQCGRCSEICPALNFKAEDIDAFPMTVAAIYPDEKILRQSSSGGVFTALSEFILKNKGIVFGAGFSKNWRVRHAAIGDSKKLNALRGIKYVQSKIGEVYNQVKKALSVTFVLFIGTPCQCAGLKYFLGGDPDNLLTAEIICPGMPSPALWESYIDRLGYAHDITSVNFQSKRNGWEKRMDINFADWEHRSSLIGDNPYGRLFQQNFSLRPSCHSCKFKFPNGQADLTFGGAWGIEDFAPEMYDWRGVSIVFIHTQKGANVLEQVNLKLQEVKFSDAVKRNPMFIASAVANSNRETFFAELADNKDRYAIMQKYYARILQSENENENIEKNAAAFKESFEAIAAQVRQKFEKNILVVFTPAHDNDRRNLEMFFERNFKNSGVYLLEPSESSTLTCTESFSQITSELKDVAELSDFVKQRNISAVYVKLPLDFGDDSPAMIDWLNNCGLPAQTFAQK